VEIMLRNGVLYHVALIFNIRLRFMLASELLLKFSCKLHELYSEVLDFL